MESEKKDDILIEKYLNSELSEAERASFQERLKIDSVFKETFTLRKSMDIFFKKEAHRPVLQAQFEQLGNEFFIEKVEKIETPKAKIVPMYQKLLWRSLATVAASVVLIFVLLNSVIWKSFSSKDLYQQYAIHQSISLVEKNNDATNAAQAQSNFNQKNYEQAYQDLNNYLQNNQDNNQAQLALGISALETAKITEAITIFTVIHEGTSLLKYSGTWYLALTYLKQKDLERTKELLLQIPNTEGFLYKKAQELILELP